jgi:glutaconate CoA-transferase subunit A
VSDRRGGRGPGGPQPSYALGITERDNNFYRQWDTISRDREKFLDWMHTNVLEATTA